MGKQRPYYGPRRLARICRFLLARLSPARSEYDRGRGQAAGPSSAHQRRHQPKFGDAALFVLKDPRICRFVPLILSILDELEVCAVAMLPLRNPLEVVSSLAERDGLTRSKSLLVWLRHVLEAEYYSRAIPRCFLNYEDLLLDWRACLGVPAGAWGSLGRAGRSESESTIDLFLTTQFRRQCVSAEQLTADPEVAFWIKDTYAIVSSLAEGGEDHAEVDRLDMIRGKFDEACAVLGPVLQEEEALAARTRDQFAKLQGALDARIIEIEALQREFQVLLDSTSWRATKPLRTLGARFPRATIFFRRSLRP